MLWRQLMAEVASKSRVLRIDVDVDDLGSVYVGLTAWSSGDLDLVRYGPVDMGAGTERLAVRLARLVAQTLAPTLFDGDQEQLAREVYA
jgi:hypothetical protein